MAKMCKTTIFDYLPQIKKKIFWHTHHSETGRHSVERKPPPTTTYLSRHQILALVSENLCLARKKKINGTDWLIVKSYSQ